MKPTPTQEARAKYTLYETTDAGLDPTWWRVKTSEDLAELKQAATVCKKWHIVDIDNSIVGEGET